MADLYTKYLKSQGMQVPYDQMTEAQINEQNKMNPLSGFGFQSAQERNRAQQQQRLYQELLRRQEDKEMQAMLMRSPPERAIGHYAGQGIGGLLNGLFNKNKGSSEAPAQDDPEVTRFNKLASEHGPAQAKLILGQELVQQGNPAGAAMIQEAQKELMDTKKDGLEMENLEGQIADRKKKPNEVRTFNTMIDGKPAEMDMELIGKHPDGTNIYKEISKGLKGSVSDTKEGWGKGKTDTSNTVQEFETKLTATANALDSMDKAEALVKENSNITGWNGRLIAKADDILSGIKGLANQAGFEGRGSYDDLSKYEWGKLEKTAAGSEKLRALVLELAAARAGATEPGGRFTEGDIQRQIDQIGGLCKSDS